MLKGAAACCVLLVCGGVAHPVSVSIVAVASCGCLQCARTA